MHPDRRMKHDDCRSDGRPCPNDGPNPHIIAKMRAHARMHTPSEVKSLLPELPSKDDDPSFSIIRYFHEAFYPHVSLKDSINAQGSGVTPDQFDEPFIHSWPLVQTGDFGPRNVPIESGDRRRNRLSASMLFIAVSASAC
jgi:hypothetical protein